MDGSDVETTRTKDEHHSFALRMAHRDDPRTLIWIGAVVIVFGVVNTLTPPASAAWVVTGDVVIGLAMIGAGFVARRPAVPDGLVPWVFATFMVVVVGWLLAIYLDDSYESNLTYVVIATTAFGPLTFAWRPFLVAAAAMLGLVAHAMTLVDQVRPVDWTIGVTASLFVSGILLRLRLQMLAEVDDAQAQVAALSTTDSLTGLLNRRGLADRIATLWADALRRDEPVAVCFLDVRGLKRANDQHGHEFGDLVIQDVADAIRATTRGSDLVARWGGDEFLIVGLAADITAGSLARRIRSHLAGGGRADRADWSRDVTVGMASGRADQVTFTALLQRADANMYGHRRPE